MDRKLLTVTETAQRLNVSADSIRRYERDGILPAAMRVGKGQRLFTEASVKRLAAERERKKAIVARPST